VSFITYGKKMCTGGAHLVSLLKLILLWIVIGRKLLDIKNLIYLSKSVKIKDNKTSRPCQNCIFTLTNCLDNKLIQAQVRKFCLNTSNTNNGLQLPTLEKPRFLHCLVLFPPDKTQNNKMEIFSYLLNIILTFYFSTRRYKQ
jgi:hypothetical protein